MTKQTRQQMLCDFLTTKKGLKEVKNPSTSKYRVFLRKDGEFYFVGKNGSLRVGKNVSTSISLTPNPKIFKTKES